MHTDDPTMIEVGVWLRGDGLAYRNWAGFIDVLEARSMPGAIPVKLDMFAYLPNDEIGCKRIDLESGQYVQGCVVGRMVYGVLNAGEVVIVGVEKRPKRLDITPLSD